MTDHFVLPTFSPRDAEEIVRRHFGVEGSASPLPSYIDQNFLIEAKAGEDGSHTRRWVLKIANDKTDHAEMEFECVAMEALARAELEVETPAVFRSRGKPLVEVESSTGLRHVVRLVDYVEGTLLAKAGAPSDALLRHFGESLAHVDEVLAGVDHPAKNRPLPWDLARSAWIVDHLDVITDPRRRAWVDHSLLQFQSRIAPVLDQLPRGIIHNDANDLNVLVDGDRVCGLFDFGDLMESGRMFEAVIAATYAAFHRPKDPIEAIAQLAAGYHSVLPFTDQEIDLFYDAVRARLAVSVVNSAKTAAEDPDNDAATVSEDGAWTLMRRLSELGPRTLRDRLRQRCGLRLLIPHGRSSSALVQGRRRHLGPSLSLSYDEPLKIVRGRMQYLYDAHGQGYLDCVNNVCHVGHSHPDVVKALSEQAAELNTNTRYLHDAIVDYVERLLGTLPKHLEVCFLVCTGSEANELALRMARTATGRHDVMVLDHAYHGHTSSLVELSPYKFDGRGGGGQPEHVHVAAAPDPYRAAAGIEGAQYAQQTVGQGLTRANEAGRPVAALFAESLLGCGGQIIPPNGYLARAFDLVRAAGGVAVADEVQVGFGRAGSHMWAFEAQGARPDIVTMGKPIGNGHPMAAVVTTRAIADKFANGMEYFNTFGGNPVSSRVGLAVLDVIERDGLMAQAARVGKRLRAGLRELATKHEVIGDVRGMGMFIGAELVRDRASKDPAYEVANAVVQHCRASGILLSVDGPFHNVLKIKPPLPFDETDATLLLGAIDRALSAAATAR